MVAGYSLSSTTSLTDHEIIALIIQLWTKLDLANNNVQITSDHETIIMTSNEKQIMGGL
jgi:hypothetical protein